MAACAAVILLLSTRVLAGDLGAVDRPLEVVQSHFEEADRCDGQVRVIGQARRGEVEALLPPSVHYHELGRRVVYSAFRGSSPLGITHVRYENGEWGLIEVAWQLDLDLTIRDFTLLRCREPAREAIDTPEFRTLLRTRNLTALRELLTEDGAFRSQAMTLDPEGRRLAGVLVASALRSLAATKVCWALSNSKLRIQRAAELRFPDAMRTVFETYRVSRSFLEALHEAGLGSLDPSVRNSLLLGHAVGADSSILGTLVHERVSLDGSAAPLLFTIVDRKLDSAVSLAVETSAPLREQLASLAGMTLQELVELDSSVAHAAAVALCVAENCGGGHENR